MRHWIPPVPLAAGMAFQLAAWAIAGAYALAPSPSLAFAWVHAVALGWLTLVALSVLLHVIPAFTDLAWRGEAVARAAVAGVLIGAVALVTAFVADAPALLRAAAALLAAAIVVYAATAGATLAQPAPDRASSAIARALAVTLGALTLTALLGAALGAAYPSGDARVLSLAPAHAVLGIGAWLTALVTGVSARTFRPMLGARSRSVPVHIAVGALVTTGSVLAAAGVAGVPFAVRAGIVLAAAGAVVYAVDTVDIVRRASSPHVAMRAFVCASAGWLLFAACAAVASAWGAPFGATATVAALAGWLGQMVNAHLHHLGVRVVITLRRGDDDETRPWEVLDARVTWCTFTLAQLAVIGLVAGVASNEGAMIGAGAAAGIATALTMLLQLSRVLTKTRPPATRARSTGCG